MKILSVFDVPDWTPRGEQPQAARPRQTETFIALATEDAPANALPPLPSPSMSSATSYDPLPLGGGGKTVFAVVIVGALIITAFLVHAGSLSLGIGGLLPP